MQREILLEKLYNDLLNTLFFNSVLHSLKQAVRLTAQLVAKAVATLSVISNRLSDVWQAEHWSYAFRMLATRRPKAAPQSREGTKRPLGTDTPYVQHANKKYSRKNTDRVTGLKVPDRENKRQTDVIMSEWIREFVTFTCLLCII